MAVKLDPNYIIMAYENVGVMESAAETLIMERPSLRIAVVNPNGAQQGRPSDFLDLSRNVLSKGQSPVILMVEHRIVPTWGLNILKQYTRAMDEVCPTFKHLPGVILSSPVRVGGNVLEDGAAMARNSLPAFPFIVPVARPIEAPKLLEQILSLSEQVQQKYGLT